MPIVANVLDRSWQEAIGAQVWHPIFIKLFEWKKPSNKQKLKHLFCESFSRCGTAMHTLITTIFLFVESVQELHDKCVFWDLEITLLVLPICLGVWSSWLPHFWKPYKYIEWQQLSDFDCLGMQTFYIGWMAVFGFVHPDKWLSPINFVASFVPVKQYSYEHRGFGPLLNVFGNTQY